MRSKRKGWGPSSLREILRCLEGREEERAVPPPRFRRFEREDLLKRVMSCRGGEWEAR